MSKSPHNPASRFLWWVLQLWDEKAAGGTVNLRKGTAPKCLVLCCSRHTHALQLYLWGFFFHPCLGISICENSSLRVASNIYIMTTLTELENFQNFHHIQKYLIYSQSLPCVCVRVRKRLCPDRPVLLQSRTWLCCSVCTHNHADLEISRCLHASCAGLGKTNGECWETTVLAHARQ